MLERVAIISGESSGELYGALLAQALKARNPEINIIGVGGNVMQSAGVELVARISSAFGLTEAVKTYAELRKTFRKVVSSLKSFRPQVLVLIDYPDFNMMVAREAKRLGIKVLYYVSPQVWAWRKKRVKVIGRLIDRMAVILPFEEEIYKKHGIPCEFVGHPALDEIRAVIDAFGGREQGISVLKAKLKEELGFQPHKPLLALMPGSRQHEVKKLMPVMAEVIKEIKKHSPDYQFVIPLAPNLDDDALSLISGLFDEKIDGGLRLANHSIKALIASDLAVIASGTSTLQACFLNIPMVVIYKLSRLTYLAGRLVVKLKHISLANILLDKSVNDDTGLRIRELLQDEVNHKNILKELHKIMHDSEYKGGILSQLEKVTNLFTHKKASRRVAEIIEELAV